jgi:hypothetical protein
MPGSQSVSPGEHFGKGSVDVRRRWIRAAAQLIPAIGAATTLIVGYR